MKKLVLNGVMHQNRLETSYQNHYLMTNIAFTLQNYIHRLYENRFFEIAVITIILLSALLIGAKTYDLDPIFINTLAFFDVAITIFFLFEISLRFIACKDKKRFFNNAWNIFDTLIVVVSLLPFDESEFAFLARLIRVFRVLRLISVIPELRILVNALIKSLPSMAYVLLLMFILFYMYAAVGSFLFERINPVLWGDISISMLTLFRVVTFEDWTDIMYETMIVYPMSWVYYLSFIFFNAFVFLNMMIGIVIGKMQEEGDLEQASEHAAEVAETRNLLEKISRRLDSIEKKIN